MAHKWINKSRNAGPFGWLTFTDETIKAESGSNGQGSGSSWACSQIHSLSACLGSHPFVHSLLWTVREAKSLKSKPWCAMTYQHIISAVQESAYCSLQPITHAVGKSYLSRTWTCPLNSYILSIIFTCTCLWNTFLYHKILWGLKKEFFNICLFHILFFLFVFVFTSNILQLVRIWNLWTAVVHLYRG